MGLYGGYVPEADKTARQPVRRYPYAKRSPQTIGVENNEFLKQYSQKYQDAKFKQEHPVRDVVAKGLHSIAMVPTVLKDVATFDFSLLDAGEFAKQRDNLTPKKILMDGAEVIALDVGGKLAGGGIKAGLKKAKGLYNAVADNVISKTTTKDIIGNNFKSEINWAKWNKEIPNNESLIKEYNAIEQANKEAGTWMKNSDGSVFKGTPEQFIQQQSDNFKKAFPNPLLDSKGNIQINYHGSPQKFSEFLPNSKMGEIGIGTYTTKDKAYAEQFANSFTSGQQVGIDTNPTIHELYQNSNNPQSSYKEYEKFASENINKFRKKTWFLPKNSKRFKRLEKEIDDKLTNRHVKDYEEGNFKLKEPFDSFTKTHQTIVPFSNNPKSAIGNNGMFDMTNPNIYKSLLPFLGYGLYNKSTKTK